MTERACDDATLRRQGVTRARSSLGPGQAVQFPDGMLYRLFGQELVARLDARRRTGATAEKGEGNAGDGNGED